MKISFDSPAKQKASPEHAHSSTTTSAARKALGRARNAPWAAVYLSGWMVGATTARVLRASVEAIQNLNEICEEGQAGRQAA